jgi:bacterioferritin-associated ferredoxin
VVWWVGLGRDVKPTDWPKVSIQGLQRHGVHLSRPLPGHFHREPAPEVLSQHLAAGGNSESVALFSKVNGCCGNCNNTTENMLRNKPQAIHKAARTLLVMNVVPTQQV